MSEVLENKSAKKSAVASKEVRAKKVNNAKIKEVNPEKAKEVVSASNKSQNVVKAKTEKISNNKSTVNKTNTNKTSSNKSSSSTTSANKKKQTSNGNSETKSGNSKLKNVDGKSKTELKESIKNEPKESLKTSEKTKTTKKVTTSKESSEKVVSKKESSKKETPKKQSLQNDSNSKKEEVKTETNNLPAPESKFDTVSLKEIREALQNKVNDNQKQKVVKKVLINIGFAMAMIVYLIVVALATKNIELSVLEKDLKIITLGILVLGIGVLERAYKKDNSQMAINAVEILVFGAINLCMMYAIKINFIKLGDFKDVVNDITFIGSVVAGYYILKSIIISVKNVRKFKKENNDIKEIIKK